MPKPTDPFSRFDPEVPMPLPAAEIRRRGDRLRRRTTGLAVAGAVAAIALVATPLAVLTGGEEARTLPPATPPSTVTDPTPTPTVTEPSPTPTESTESSAPTRPDRVDDLSSFPLTMGWPDPDAVEGPEFGLDGPGDDIEGVDYVVCRETLAIPETTGDLQARYTNVEDERVRRLLTFATADEAVAFMARARAFTEACPQQSNGPDSTLQNETIDTSRGGESFAAIQSLEMFGEPALGLWVTELVRLGRAVLVDRTYGEGFRESAPGVLEAMGASSVEVVAAMCAFTEAGC